MFWHLGKLKKSMCFFCICISFNFHPLEVVSRLRDPQRQVGELFLICQIDD